MTTEPSKYVVNYPFERQISGSRRKCFLAFMCDWYCSHQKHWNFNVCNTAMPLEDVTIWRCFTLCNHWRPPNSWSTYTHYLHSPAQTNFVVTCGRPSTNTEFFRCILERSATAVQARFVQGGHNLQVIWVVPSTLSVLVLSNVYHDISRRGRGETTHTGLLRHQPPRSTRIKQIDAEGDGVLRITVGNPHTRSNISDVWSWRNNVRSVGSVANRVVV